MDRTQSNNSKVWFITGVSSGIGRALAKAALRQGDTVIGSLRKPEQIVDFEAQAPGRAYALLLDVTRPEQIRDAVEHALGFRGRIDVLVNNAGVGMVGAIEETSSDEAHAIFETNFFGPFQLIRSALPHLRKQGSGHIINISSAAGISAVPGLGIYSASKFAVEGMTEALAAEVAALGIKVSLVEPGAILTNFPSTSIVEIQVKISSYSAITGQGRAGIQHYYQQQAQDPEVVARAVLDLVKAPSPPLRLIIGDDAMAGVQAKISLLQNVAQAGA